MALPLIIMGAVALTGAVGATAVLVDKTGDTIEQTGDAVEQTGNASLKFAVLVVVAAGAYVVFKSK